MPNFQVSTGRGPARPAPVVVTLAARASHGEVDAACAALGARLRQGAMGPVVCDVAALAHSDLGTVDLICRLGMTARACGSRLVLRGAPWHLRSLLLFAGLRDVLPCVEDDAAGSVEPER